jgi:multidrug efflux system membrane fusion protein
MGSPEERTLVPSAGEASEGRSSAWVWVLLTGAALIIGVVAWFVLKKAGAEKADAAQASAPSGGGARGRGAGGTVPVSVATAEKRDLPVYLTGLGSVAALNTVSIKSRVDGAIVGLPFREGQEVKQGDLLAVIDPRPFEVLLHQSEANVEKDKAQLADARLNLDRYKDLYEQGVLPQQQYDSQSALVHQFEGALGVDAAAVENARLQLTYSRITAPISGRIGLRQVDIGNMVHASDPTGLLVLTQLDPISVVFTLPEDNLPTVAKGIKKGTLPADAYSRDDRTKLATGTLLTVDNEIDAQTGTGKLKATFPNPDHSMWPNQFVNVHLRVDVRHDQTVIPSAALQRSSQGTLVYVVKPDQTVETRSLKVNLVQGDVAAIDEGVSAGDVVVTDGQEKLQAGTKVEVRKPDAGNPAASPTGKSKDHGLKANGGGSQG